MGKANKRWVTALLFGAWHPGTFADDVHAPPYIVAVLRPY